MCRRAEDRAVDERMAKGPAVGVWKRMARWKRWTILGVAAVAVLVVAGPFVYIHVIEGKAPAPLALPSGSTTDRATGTATATDGEWDVADGSIVGYRVEEVLFGQSNVAAGRTGAVTGSLIVDGSSIAAATFTVDMTTVSSDESRRDGQFNERIMETATYPTATFELTEPISFGTVPATGNEQTFQATGDLTMHGITRAVTFDVTGRYTGTQIQVAGSIPVTFADWSISNPSFGPVETEDHGVLEFSLLFQHA